MSYAATIYRGSLASKPDGPSLSMRRSFTHRNLPVADGERPHSPALGGSRRAPGALLAGDEPQRYIVRGGVGWWVRATSPPGFRPRIGVRGRLFAGMTNGGPE